MAHFLVAHWGCAVDTTGVFAVEEDAGRDAGFDAGSDGGLDGGSDGGFDGGSDGGFDAGLDGGLDAGVDGGFDAGVDGGVDGGGGCVPGSTGIDSMCGLRVWLDAHSVASVGGATDTWPNLAPVFTGELGVGDALVPSSSTGSPVVQTDPSGRPYVEFDSMRCLQTERSISEVSTTHFEFFAVMRIRAFTRGTLLWLDGNYRVFFPWTDGHWYIDLPQDALRRWSGEYTWGTDLVLVHVTAGESEARLEVDDVTINAGPGLRSSTDTNPDVPLRIGGNCTSGNLDLDLYELLVFDEPLSTPQRTAVTDELNSRWVLGL